MTHRQFKDRLYAQLARLGKALSSPHRLDLLAQGERTVESLATELELSIANVSRHVQALKHAALVTTRKQGLFVGGRVDSSKGFPSGDRPGCGSSTAAPPAC